MMAGRDPRQVVAATRSAAGTDVNFGALTRMLLDDAADRGVAVHCNQRVQGLERETDGRWAVTVRDAVTGERRTVRTRFVFVGAGGGALPLLQRSGIPEIARLRRLPGQRQVPADDVPRAGQRPPGQGLRPGRGRRAADVGAAPGPPPDRRRPLADVRPLRRLLPEVPQGRVALDLPRQRPAGQPGLHARRRAHRAGPHPLPGPRADAVRRRPAPDPGALRARGRTSTTGRWSPPASGSR